MKWILTKRALLVGLIAGSGVLAASAYAMSSDLTDGKPGCEMRHGEVKHAQMVERRDARMAGLKEKLKLTDTQSGAWQAYVAAEQLKLQAQGGDRNAMREAYAKMDTPQRLDSMLAKSELRHAHMVARVEAVKSFYAQLTPEQQAVFDAEAKLRSGHGHHGAMRHQS